MIEALIKSVDKGQYWSNWSKTVQCVADSIFYPKKEEEIVEIIHYAKSNGKRIRVAGSGHSFSRLMETNQIIVVLTYLRGIINIDKEKKQATIWAGTSIKDANDALYRDGLAMINLGDIDVQTVSGATATGTHGTGTSFGNISSEIVHFTIVTAAGEILECSKEENSDLFEAGRVSLGALGIITKITFNVADAYKLKYTSSAGKFEATLDKLEEYNQNNRNFEFYYFPFSDTIQLKESNITDERVKHNKLIAHLSDVFVENTVMQIICKLGKNIPALHKKLSRFMAWGVPKGTKVNYSHEIYATVRNVRFKEMEYNIPIEHFKECALKMKAMVEEKSYPIFFPSECRFVKGDDIWLSPAYQRDSAYIAIHVYHETDHKSYFSDMEALFTSYGGRPHWGKMHTRTAAYLSKNYEKWDDFLALRQKMDPTKLFLNPHLEEVFGVE